MKLTYSQDEIKAVIIKSTASDDKLNKLTNLNTNSVWMLTVNGVARAYEYFINGVLQYLYAAIFPQSSDRYSLSRHMQDEGLIFKEKAKATVVMRLGCKTKPESEIQIPQGSVIKTKGSEAKCYEITDGGSVDTTTVLDTRGFYTETFSAIAVDTGESYNVPADSITELESSIDEIDVVYNPAASSGGMDDETEESGYQRLLDAKNAKARGSMTWYKSESEKISGVKQAIIVPRYAGRGTIGIVIIGYGGLASQEVLDSVGAFFNTDENDPAGAAHVLPVHPAIMKQSYSISIWYDRDKGAPTDEALTTALAEYIENLDAGADHVLSVIEAYLLNKFSLKDVRITTPSSNVPVPSGSLSSLDAAAWMKEVWVDA